MSTGPFIRDLRIVGVSRVADAPWALLVSLDGTPNDGDIRRLHELLASPLCFRVDRERDLVHIGGIQYSGELFREFGFKAAVGQLLRIEERQRGVLSVSRAQAPAQATLLQALRFYARRKHLVIDEEHQEMDQVSGEPANWLCSHREGDTTMLEDGSIARMALRGEQVHWGDLGEASAPQPLDDEAYVSRISTAGPDFEFWWAEHMPSATQSAAWAAWVAAAPAAPEEEQQAEREMLTRDDIIRCWGDANGLRNGYGPYARAIERTLAERWGVKLLPHGINSEAQR